MTKLSDVQYATIKDIGRGFFTQVKHFSGGTLKALEKKGLIFVKTFKTVPSKAKLTAAGRKIFKSM